MTTPTKVCRCYTNQRKVQHGLGNFGNIVQFPNKPIIAQQESAPNQFGEIQKQL